ncbi:guanine-N1-methyltransferase [Sporodiniella umbellata]|nr:guanine-N1-methyltransferase [Sporodiniella umbellata]
MKVGNVGVLFDCSFSELMLDKEINSLRQQICRSYTANVRAQKLSMKMSLTSMDKKLTDMFDAKASNWKNWRNVDFFSEPLTEKFDKENLVYLTADSENVVRELEEGKTYIVGAIVDKNRHKNICKEKAEKEGIKTARLPIGDYMSFASRKVLTVNQVVEIMIKWLDCNDWKEAFEQVIPSRKLKNSIQSSKDEEGTDLEDEEVNSDESETENQEQSLND